MLSETEFADDRLALIRLALAEDRTDDDVTSRTLVPAHATGSAVVVAKEAGIHAGAEHARLVFAAPGADLAYETLVASGEPVRPGQEIARAAGNLRGLLARERTAVNLIQRMSGIATLTRKFVDAVQGTRAKILATRKTAPGLRAFDLFAVTAGGGFVHRRDLAERVLVKENHLRAACAAGSARTMAEIVARLLRENPGVPIGVEAVDLDELRAALAPGVEVVLLDNFPRERVAAAVRLRDQAFPAGGGPDLEVSGGVTLETVRGYADTGVERISVGALTHSAPALDVSMRIVAP